MPPKSGNDKLRHTQLSKSTAAKSSPTPVPPPLRMKSPTQHRPSTSSPGAAATRVEESAQQQPTLPHLFLLTAPDEVGPSSTTIVTANPEAESENSVRSIRCKNVDGKAPAKLHTVIGNKTQHMVKMAGSKLKAVCERNKLNRTKNPNPINHHSGPKPISFRAEELMNKNHHAGILGASIQVYEPYPNTKERVEKMKSKVEQITQTQASQ